MKSEELYSMKIGDRKEDSTKIVERVPGGWNYIYIYKGLITAVNVPLSNIDKPKKPKQTELISITSGTIEERKIKFKRAVVESAKGKGYTIEMQQEFFLYWSEHGENDKKMRYEKQGTFGISNRLYNWNKKSNAFQEDNTETPALRNYKKD